MKKMFYYLTGFFFLIAHLLLLGWMIYALRETGNLPVKEVFLHFLGMAVYGGLLIWFSARHFRKYPR